MICCSLLTLRLSVKFYFKLITSDHFNMTTTVEKTAHNKYVYANLMWLLQSTHTHARTRGSAVKKKNGPRFMCTKKHTLSEHTVHRNASLHRGAISFTLECKKELLYCVRKYARHLAIRKHACWHTHAPQTHTEKRNKCVRGLDG